MKTILKSVLAITVLLVASCSSRQSLQEYYVDNKENPNFIAIDVPASILKMDEVSITEDQKKAVSSLKKLNVLAFRKTSENAAAYTLEKAKVKEILKDDKFIDLMKMNSGYGNGVIKYLGDDEAIDEVIIFGDNKEKGFALVRVLGKDMNPANIMQLAQAIQKSDYKGEGLEGLDDFFN